MFSLARLVKQVFSVMHGHGICDKCGNYSMYECIYFEEIICNVDALWIFYQTSILFTPLSFQK